jgi:hypothetical protein
MYNLHWVQHIQCTPYNKYSTQYSLSVFPVFLWLWADPCMYPQLRVRLCSRLTTTSQLMLTAERYCHLASFSRVRVYWMINRVNSALSVPPNDCLQDLVRSPSIMTCKSIFKITRSWAGRESRCSLNHGLQVYLQTCSIMAWCSHQHGLPNASPYLLNHGVQVDLWVLFIIIFRCSMDCSEKPPAASPDIPFVHGSLHRYIDTEIHGYMDI